MRRHLPLFAVAAFLGMGCPKRADLSRGPPPSLMDSRITKAAKTGQLSHPQLSPSERDAKASIPLAWLSAADLPCPAPWSPDARGFWDGVAAAMVAEDALRLAHQPVGAHFCVVSESIDPRLISTFPQLQSLPRDGNYDREDPNSAYRLTGYWDLPPSSVDFGTPRLGGNLTDVVSASYLSGAGFLVSQRARDLLEQFALGPHTFVPLTLQHSGEEHDYYWFQVDHRDSLPIDWERSTFATFGTAEASHEVRFGSRQALESYRDTLRDSGYIGDFYTQRIVLSVDFAWDLDVVHLPNTAQMLFSKLLAEAIEAAGLTGWEYETTRQLFVPGELDDAPDLLQSPSR